MSLTAESALVLDAIVPLDRPRVDYHDWDERRWGQTLQIADWHRVSPLLFCYLDPRQDAPAAVLSALERGYLANAARSMFMTSALRGVVDALLADGISAVLLKGAALIETVYPDPAQREMLDLDLLVPAARLHEASALLAPLGYRARSPEGDELGATMGMRIPLDQHHAPALIGDDQLLAVELHRHILIGGEGTRFDIDEFWQRSRPSANGDYLLPSPEDLLIHVCLHFTRNRVGGSYRRRHTGGALGQICDIARIVAYEPVDWSRLADTARRYHLEARVFLGLFAARELGVTIPDGVLDDLQPRSFDPVLGRRLVALRVLRAGNHLPVRSLRWMFAPSREVLSQGWNADPTATMSLARAYMRRARANAPLARSAFRRPWLFVQDQRLNDQIRALEERV
jgi:hypothetical protein